jgi:tetratricopeptide (TPR) repeat protein
MAEAESGAAGGYVAFISYSHKDAATGRWLHRKLEGYRLPRRLAGSQGEDGEVPARLTPIFRDRDELPAAGDLSERVRAALAVSKNLIVVCSPHSAASPWVAKEITTFRELHPERPIFTAIVEGEPGQCFSPALLEGGVEPLAADLRKQGDGRRLGLLKLVAGLSGVGLDDLVQRDATRRVRRVTYVTAAAVAAMLVMALLMVVAFSARADAERQRSKAEGLVEFMLTDLRDRLEGVGSLQTMEAVNSRALRYYGDQTELNGLPDDSLLRRARILRAIGDDRERLGDADGALLAYQEARRTTAEQLARRPDDPERQLAHGRMEYGIGRIHELRKEWPQAQERYARFSAITEGLLAKAPRNPTYLAAAASAAIDLGNVQLLGREDFDGARRHYKRAITHLALAARLKPGDHDLVIQRADAHAWLADSFARRGLLNDALRERMNQYHLIETLYRAYPSNHDYSLRFARAQRGLATTLSTAGQPAEARMHLFQAYDLAGRLVRRDPKNVEWLLFRGKLDCDLFFRKLGLPNDTTREQVGREARSIAQSLKSLRSPRAAELERCVAAINRPLT